ncbi:MAG TPA: cadherin domain-containing protein, partial [Allosphingosinicella sp.]|nr:cadherin domain-containing protein [Allosphingosinicella sp.]
QGIDKLYGGSGNDTLYGGGFDHSEADELYGEAGLDLLVGSWGDDVLDGGKDADVDKLHGGVGNDTYHIYAGDIFATAAESGQGQEAEINGFGGGVDHVISHVASYTLQFSFENLTLAANALSGFGSEDDNEILGNDDDNTLGGNGGFDKITGGTGRDTMTGGSGNDIFYIAKGDAVAGESINGGADTDRIETASATLDLRGVTISELEEIRTVNNAGTAYKVDSIANALLLHGGSGNDSVVLVGATLTVNQRDAIFAQGIETITDASGTYEPNTAPAITSDGGGSSVNLFVPENGSLVTQVVASDADPSQTLTYSILSAGDAAAFQIGASNGIVSFVSVPDFENPTAVGGGNVYTITVRVEDGQGGADEQSLVIQVTDQNSFTGNSGPNFIGGDNGADTMSGGGGDDSYIVNHIGDQVFEAAGGGTDQVQASVNFDLAGQEIEKLTLTGAAVQATGNELANVLIGTNAANTLDGKGANDSMTGHDGTDTYYVDHVSDKVFEGATGDSDRVVASLSYALAGGSQVEFLQTIRAVETTAINLTGNEFVNRITGNAGANILNGGGEADVLTGLDGSDTYIVDEALDRVIEGETGDSDRVVASVSYALAAGAQVEFLQTIRAVETTAINLTGNEYANAITGNAGANTLNGGAGIDSMTGLDGSDTYHVDNALDKVTEGATGDNDRVVASVSYTLAAGVQVEHLQTIRAVETTAINLTGNEFANTITGNAGANVLKGGTGIDTMTGLDGSDTYYVDRVSDKVVEGLTGDNDRVVASLSYSLAAGSQVEHLQTIRATATTAINLTGNEFVNVITGNAGVNVLNGKGAADTMTGLDGSDTYHVDNALDQVAEGATGDLDQVIASVSYVLTAGSQVEIMKTINSAATTAIHLTGNQFANQIAGNAGRNTLNGAGGIDTLNGGAGRDSLTGGTAADRFEFDVAPGTANADVIEDFSVADDTIRLDRAIFTQITADGTLALAAFHTGAAAHDATDRIIYNDVTGRIFYDADGNGGGAALLVATVDPGLALTNLDFSAYTG